MLSPPCVQVLQHRVDCDDVNLLDVRRRDIVPSDGATSHSVSARLPVDPTNPIVVTPGFCARSSAWTVGGLFPLVPNTTKGSAGRASVAVCRAKDPAGLLGAGGPVLGLGRPGGDQPVQRIIAVVLRRFKLVHLVAGMGRRQGVAGGVVAVGPGAEVLVARGGLIQRGVLVGHLGDAEDDGTATLSPETPYSSLACLRRPEKAADDLLRPNQESLAAHRSAGRLVLP